MARSDVYIPKPRKKTHKKVDEKSKEKFIYLKSRLGTWKTVNIDNDLNYFKNVMKDKGYRTLPPDKYLFSEMEKHEGRRDYDKDMRKRLAHELKVRPKRRALDEQEIPGFFNKISGTVGGSAEKVQRAYLKKKIGKFSGYIQHPHTDPSKSGFEYLEKAKDAKTLGLLHQEKHVAAIKTNPKKRRITVYETAQSVPGNSKRLREEIAARLPNKGDGWDLKIRKDDYQRGGDKACSLYGCKNILDKYKGKKRRIGVTKQSVQDYQKVMDSTLDKAIQKSNAKKKAADGKKKEN